MGSHFTHTLGGARGTQARAEQGRASVVLCNSGLYRWDIGGRNCCSYGKSYALIWYGSGSVVRDDLLKLPVSRCCMTRRVGYGCLIYIDQVKPEHGRRSPIKRSLIAGDSEQVTIRSKS